MPQGTKHLTKAQIEQIGALHRAGLNTHQIVVQTGHTVYQVRHWIKRLGHKLQWSRNGVCWRRADDLRRWAAEGVSLSEMARRIGTNHHRVADFLDRHNIDRVRFEQSGANNPAWKGGRQIDKNGYVLVHQPDHPAANRHGYVREHRIVMEQILGRLLTSEEVVHHKDDNHANNDPANLQLYSTNAAHLSETRKGLHPEWTEEGLRKIRERWSRLGAERKISSRLQRRGPDGSFVRGKIGQTSE